MSSLLSSKLKKGIQARRRFIKSSMSLAAIPFILPKVDLFTPTFFNQSDNQSSMAAEKSIIGGYGTWAASLVGMPSLSFRNSAENNLDSWKTKALLKTQELLAQPPKSEPTVTVE